MAQNLIAGKNVLTWLIILLWILIWKGYALWTAAKLNQRGWFIALLIINTFGVLEIIYIFGVAKKSFADIRAFFSLSIKRKEAPKDPNPQS